MTKESKYTPTPWEFEPHPEESEYFGNIIGNYGKDGDGVSRIRTITCQLKHGTDEENQANAKRIVHCVNHFDELVEALNLIQLLSSEANAKEVGVRKFGDLLIMIESEAKQALSRAKGETDE